MQWIIFLLCAFFIGTFYHCIIKKCFQFSPCVEFKMGVWAVCGWHYMWGWPGHVGATVCMCRLNIQNHVSNHFITFYDIYALKKNNFFLIPAILIQCCYFIYRLIKWFRWCEVNGVAFASRQCDRTQAEKEIWIRSNARIRLGKKERKTKKTVRSRGPLTVKTTFDSERRFSYYNFFM